MLITITGRKTGKKYTTPVGYYRENGYLWILSSRDRTWWKNLQGGTEVSLLLKGQPIRAFAELELNSAAVEAQMQEYIKHVPQAAKPLGTRVENEKANVEDIIRTAKDRLFVRLKIES